MTQNQVMWSKVTKAIFTGVLIIGICGMLLPIFELIIGTARDVVVHGSGLARSFGATGGKFVALWTGGVWGIFCSILIAAIIFGWNTFSNGLSAFAKMLEPADSASFAKVRNGIMLLMIGFGVRLLMGFLIFPGAIWLDNLLYAAYFVGCAGGYLMMMLGFSELKQSNTFPEKARNGANLLFVAMILLMVGPALSLLNMGVSLSGLAPVLNIICGIGGFIVMIIGWSRMKEA